MSVFRCKPGQLVMSEAVPFGQQWTYYSQHPMEEMLDPKYFISQIGQLRTGDVLNILRVINNQVTEYVKVLVASSEKESKTLQFHIMDGPEKISDAEIPNGGLVVTKKLHVKRGFGCFEVLSPEGKVLDSFDTKGQALDFVKEYNKAA